MKFSINQDLQYCKDFQQKKLAVLIDPDKVSEKGIDQLIENAIAAEVDYLFVGGSLLVDDSFEHCISHIKAHCKIPLIIFPGSIFQMSAKADAIFFLSLISGRNPELLIGQQVLAAPILRSMDIEVMPTGYMLVDGGAPTTVSYISNSQPIPRDKPPIAVCTALAGEMLGHKLIYMDSGSGAQYPVSEEMIRAVANNVNVPLVIGGGIRNPETAAKISRAGAELIVVGNAFEKEPNLVFDMCQAVHECSLALPSKA